MNLDKSNRSEFSGQRPVEITAESCPTSRICERPLTGNRLAIG